jgi:ABC-2 type transport system permease protein
MNTRSTREGNSMHTFSALYDVMLRMQFNRTRVLALGALGVVGIFVGLIIGRFAEDVTISDRINFINGFGLAVVLPVSVLVFASASFGDLVEDQTLVYLWLRDVPRWLLSASAVLSTLTIVIPLVALPLVATAVAAELDSDAVLGSVIATIVGALAYTGVFTALGLRAKRALAWGLLYIFIWEQFIARAGKGVRRFALSAYTRSVLSKISGVDLTDADISSVFAVVIPIVVGVVAFGYVTNRLHRHDVA